MPEMMPITTGLGEIYHQYILKVGPEIQKQVQRHNLRTIQDWIEAAVVGNTGHCGNQQFRRTSETIRGRRRS